MVVNMDFKNLKWTEIDSEIKNEIVEIMEFYKKNRSAIKSTILKIIEEIKNIAQNYDPFTLLTYIMSYITSGAPTDHYGEVGQKLLCHLEYALSLITALEGEKSNIQPPPNVISDFIKKIIQIFNLLVFYYQTEEKKDKYREVRVNSITTFITTRGDSYPSHHIALIKGLFSPHENFLKRHFSFNIDNYFQYIKEIENQLNKSLKDFNLTFENHKSDLKDESIIKKLADDYRQIYVIHPNVDLPEEFLNLFSISLGDNSVFNEWKIPLWPLNDSEIYNKPLIRLRGKYYAFGISILNSNIKNILENLIQRKDAHYFSRSYEKARGKWLELIGSKCFKKIFPDTEVYGRLYYPLSEDPNDKTDTDGLILFDNNILIIEAKATKYKIPARRGSLKSIKEFVNNTIDKAYVQAKRTKEYIQKNNIARFEDETGKEILVETGKYENFFLINVTLEKLNFISSRLHDVKDLGFIEGNLWPWSVYINDLRVISKIIESPSIFLSYLINRLEENNRNKLLTSDELDYFMYFLEAQMGIYDSKLNGLKLGVIDQMTMKLDAYYYYGSKKPIFKIPKRIKEIIKILEIQRNSGFSKVTLFLLNLPQSQMTEFARRIKSHARRSRQQKKDKLSFYGTEKNNTIMLLIIRMHSASQEWDIGKNKLREAMKEKNKEEGIFFMCYKKDDKISWNFEFLTH